MDKQQLWEKAAAFHGHVCPGLTIGYRAALYAIDLLELTFSKDEQVVCITENDACGVDAIQAILGCSVGKGNLLFHMRGKQAFSFYNRKTGKAVRLMLKTWIKDAKIKDVGAYFAVSDAQKELSPWGSRLRVTSRGYMLGYNDLKDPSVSGYFRFLAKVGDHAVKMQIVKIDFLKEAL